MEVINELLGDKRDKRSRRVGGQQKEGDILRPPVRSNTENMLVTTCFFLFDRSQHFVTTTFNI